MTQDDTHLSLRKRHPVSLRQAVFPTKASEELFAQCQASVSVLRKGMVVVAEPLSGLTTAIRLIAQGWQVACPDIPMVVIRAPAMGKIDATPFLRAFSGRSQRGIYARSKWNEEILRLGISRSLTTEALSRQSDRLLLIVDQAHNMSSAALSQLGVLQDELGSDQIHLVVILAGHPSFMQMREELHADARLEPMRRYFEIEMRFSGVRSAQDLSYFLESFDNTEYPIGSEWPMSRFYYRDAYDRGWRLWQEASNAWASFERMAMVSADRLEIEMHYVLPAICTLLESALDHGYAALPPDREAWQLAIESSGFIESQRAKSRFINRTQEKA